MAKGFNKLIENLIKDGWSVSYANYTTDGGFAILERPNHHKDTIVIEVSQQQDSLSTRIRYKPKVNVRDISVTPTIDVVMVAPSVGKINRLTTIFHEVKSYLVEMLSELEGE